MAACMYVHCACRDAYEGQKRAWGPLNLELKMAVCCCMGAGNHTRVLCKRDKRSLPLGHCIPSLHLFFVMAVSYVLWWLGQVVPCAFSFKSSPSVLYSLNGFHLLDVSFYSESSSTSFLRETWAGILIDICTTSVIFCMTPSQSNVKQTGICK